MQSQNWTSAWRFVGSSKVGLLYGVPLGVPLKGSIGGLLYGVPLRVPLKGSIGGLF